MKQYVSGLAALLMLALPVAGFCAEATAGAPGMDLKSGYSGKVVETKTAGDYTYISLEKDKERAWVACPVMTVNLGQQLTFRGCTPMMNFESKALKRTFDLILFCGAPLSAEAAEILSKNSTGSDVAVPELKEKVDTASGANAHTVADCYAKSAELNNKKVIVKGKVMKVNPRIMGRTWIHLQDGSGSAIQKNNDIVITTVETPRVGEVVTFDGTLVKDKDFGSGYSYKVIIEDATFHK